MAVSRAAYNKAWRDAHPELRRAQQQRSYWKNAEKRRALSRKHYRENKETHLAYNKKWREENKEHLAKTQLAYRDAHKAELLEKARERRRLLKLRVLKAYGEFCACCGETDWELLTIDHPKGGGTKHRDEINCYGSQFYKWLEKNGFPSGYQTFCWNCNCSRGQYGYCPHQIGPNKFHYEQLVKEMSLAALAKLQRK